MESAAIAQAAQPEEEARPSFYMDPMMAKRYGLIPSGPMTETTETTETKAPVSTNEISVITLNCRGIALNAQNETTTEGNSRMAFALARELQESPYFDPNETKLDGKIQPDETLPPTFKFKVLVKLKNPIKL